MTSDEFLGFAGTDTVDVLALTVLGVVLAFVVGTFIRLCLRVRRAGGSLTTIVLGATDEFLTRDRSRAAETIVNENAGKKQTHQSNDEPRHKSATTSKQPTTTRRRSHPPQ